MPVSVLFLIFQPESKVNMAFTTVSNEKEVFAGVCYIICNNKTCVNN